MTDPNVIRGLASPDDAGVYKLTDSLAIIQTVDFFTPIVDDPYTFGQIAVANALSDVYAMGGTPLTAMNIVCFPVKSLDISVLKSMLRGGIDKMIEAKVVLVGGHSIDDKELKYGLSVTGTIHPDKLITNSGAEAGDILILTKPVGTGVISTAVKSKVAGEETAAMVARYMATLNNKAADLMQDIGVHACTDITGFGLIGHIIQLAENSEVGVRIDSTAVPLLPQAEEFVKQGLCPGGLTRNKKFYSKSVVIEEKVSDTITDLFYDPQTSGGLLISLSQEKATLLLERLWQAGIKDAVIIGEVVGESPGTIRVTG